MLDGAFFPPHLPLLNLMAFFFFLEKMRGFFKR